MGALARRVASKRRQFRPRRQKRWRVGLFRSHLASFWRFQPWNPLSLRIALLPATASTIDATSYHFWPHLTAKCLHVNNKVAGHDRSICLTLKSSRSCG